MAEAGGTDRDEENQVAEEAEGGETRPNHAAEAACRYRAALAGRVAVGVQRLQDGIALNSGDGAENEAGAEQADDAHDHDVLTIDERAAAAHGRLAAKRGEYIGLLRRVSLLCQ